MEKELLGFFFFITCKQRMNVEMRVHKKDTHTTTKKKRYREASEHITKKALGIRLHEHEIEKEEKKGRRTRSDEFFHKKNGS